jgi:hypothetical protein
MMNDPAKDIAKYIAEDVSAQGLQLLMETLSKETLTKLASHWKVEYPGYGDNPKPSKRLMAKRLVAGMAENGPKDFFLQSDAYLSSIIGDLELTGVTAKDKDKAAKALIAEADALGVEHCLSAFAFDKLQDFALNSGLKVYGSSREKLLDALIERKNMDKPEKKTRAKAPKVSKDKPKIAKGISAVDLNSWYYSKDLSDWLEKKKLPSKGTKKELVKRILDHLAGKDVTIKPKEKKVKKKKAPPKAKSGKGKVGRPAGTKRKAAEKDAEKSESGEEAPAKKKQKTTA